MHQPTHAWTASVAALLLATAPHATAQFNYRTVAIAGDQAPGTDPGVVFEGFGNAFINSSGQVAFQGYLTGPGVVARLDSAGVWSEGSGSGLALIARQNDAAPGTEPDVNLGTFDISRLSDNGQIAFTSYLQGSAVSSTNQYGLWLHEEGVGLSKVAYASDPAPGTAAGAVFSGMQTPNMSSAGQPIFNASLAGPGLDNSNNRGLWTLPSGSGLTEIVRRGDPAPGVGAGVSFGDINSLLPLNQAGQTVFHATIEGVGVDSTNNSGIWLANSASVSLAVRTGDAAPGTPAGVSFSGLSVPLLNNAGQIAFNAVITGTGVDSSNDAGVWAQNGSGLTLVAREGDAAPGTEPGVHFDFNFGTISPINGSGTTAFNAYVAGPGVDSTNDRGIWINDSVNGLTLVAREGDPAPGVVEPGVTFRDFTSTAGFQINGTGQIAFKAALTGPGIDNSNLVGFWATDPSGTLHLIARDGDLFDVNDDPLIEEFKTISNGRLETGSGGEDGRHTGFNDAGELVIELTFTDGSEGLFVFTVPEPSSLAALLAVGAPMMIRRRRGQG